MNIWRYGDVTDRLGGLHSGSVAWLKSKVNNFYVFFVDLSRRVPYADNRGQGMIAYAIPSNKIRLIVQAIAEREGRENLSCPVQTRVAEWLRAVSGKPGGQMVFTGRAARKGD